jgi:hypothetical protein
MNLTNKLTNYTVSRADWFEAAKQFLSEYPGVVYNPEDDTFEWRSHRFDYFKSGRYAKEIDGKLYWTNRHKYTLAYNHNGQTYGFVNSPEDWDNILAEKIV